MEIQLSPDRKAHLVALAAGAGRSPSEVIREAVALWEERENDRALGTFRVSLDQAEGSVAQSKGRVITQESMRTLTGEVHQRGLARLAAEQKTSR
jgi:predicted transcriptional regulator